MLVLQSAFRFLEGIIFLIYKPSNTDGSTDRTDLRTKLAHPALDELGRDK